MSTIETDFQGRCIHCGKQLGTSATCECQMVRSAVMPTMTTPNLEQIARETARKVPPDHVAHYEDCVTEIILAALRQVAPQPAKEDAYWAGYKARLDESTQEQPEPTSPTLWRYLQNAHEKQITFHTIGVNRMPDGGFHFYIHPQAVSGDTEDYLIWPDPFSWDDMLVNRKDSQAPDIEKFKSYLKKQSAIDSAASGRAGK